MWADLWLAYHLAPISLWDDRNRFNPGYRGRVHYLVPLMGVSLHIPSPDTCWALPYRYQLRSGKSSRIERIGEDHDYLPLERIDPPVAHSYPPLDARAQQLWDELLECSRLNAERHERERERENRKGRKGKCRQEDN